MSNKIAFQTVDIVAAESENGGKQLVLMDDAFVEP
jgi:hypothetical protein